ncbi:uncharacterized protein SAPINGB_P001471 [Magnusiomyces paraingens]|uniref:Structure-specific endonuclease subunit SLX4 n=1 Tax=Magnusiomyces paraingens TaxID=2606893 RepID=A0A5E8B5W6_9ASCO|nr:uncharacterized protein SAPINGB_P001471 [Saprochaete ingens]VVT46956.1 unnamed protein product [Saprochaete ingens]
MDIEILRGETTLNTSTAPLVQTATQSSIASDNEDEQSDTNNNRFQQFIYDGTSEKSAFDKSFSDKYPSPLERNISPDFDSKEQLGDKQTGSNSFNKRRNQDPEDSMQKLLFGKKIKGRRANILSEKLTEKKVQTRLNLGPNSDSSGKSTGNKLTLDFIDPVEELDKIRKNSPFLYFYDSKLFKESSKLLFKNILSPEEAVKRIKLARLRFPFIKISRSYCERQINKTLPEIYPGILFNQDVKEEDGNKTKLYSQFRRTLYIAENSNKRKYCYFERPNVTMCEYDHLPPSSFTIQDVEILHGADKEYFESQLKTLAKEEEEARESKHRLEEQRKMEEETEIEDSEPEYFQPLSYNLSNSDDEIEPISSSVYEPEPLVWPKRTKTEIQNMQSDGDMVEIIDYTSDVEIIDCAPTTRISVPTKQIENNATLIDRDDDESIEIIEIPESPMAFKIDSLFSEKQVNDLIKAQLADGCETQHVPEEVEEAKQSTNILQQKSVNLLTQKQPSNNNQLYQKKKRDFTKMTTIELRKQVDDWGFKPCRSRMEMIKLLDSCNVYSPIPGSVLAQTMSRKENVHLDIDHGFQSKSFSEDMVQTIKQLPKHKKDLENLSTGDLKELLYIYGFKPVKGRSRILEILRECYNTSDAITTSTETTPENFENNPLNKTTVSNIDNKESNTTLTSIDTNTYHETPIEVSIPYSNISTNISISNFGEKFSNAALISDDSSNVSAIQENIESEGDTHISTLEKIPTKELRELIKRYGFKPVRNRSRMIELLKDCYGKSPTPASFTEDKITFNSNSDKALDIEISRRISTAFLTEDFAKDIWTKILTYEPLNLDEICGFLEEKLGMKLEHKFVREWCDQHGVTTTVAEERT